MKKLEKCRLNFLLFTNRAVAPFQRPHITWGHSAKRSRASIPFARRPRRLGQGRITRSSSLDRDPSPESVYKEVYKRVGISRVEV